MGIGLTGSPKVKEEWYTLTRTFTKDSGMRESEMGTVCSPREMEITLKGIGWMTCGKVKAVTIIMIKTNYS
jgi:hypothetical protein